MNRDRTLKIRTIRHPEPLPSLAPGSKGSPRAAWRGFFCWGAWRRADGDGCTASRLRRGRRLFSRWGAC
jgi:hypothetical protein